LLPPLAAIRISFLVFVGIPMQNVQVWEDSVTPPDNIDLGRLQTRLALERATSEGRRRTRGEGRARL
jgi:hypothetical protein